MSAKKTSPTPIEVMIRLTDEQAKALLYWNKRQHPQVAPLVSVLRWTMAFALTHPTEYAAWISRVVDYCQAEDLDQWKLVNRKLAKMPGYARTKIPAVA